MSTSIYIWIPKRTWPSAQDVQKALVQDRFPVSLVNMDSLNRGGLFWPHCDDSENDVDIKSEDGTVSNLHLTLETRTISEHDLIINQDSWPNLIFVDSIMSNDCIAEAGDMYSWMSIGSSAVEWIPMVYISATLVKHFEAGVVYGDIENFNGDIFELVRNADSMWKRNAPNS